MGFLEPGVLQLAPLGGIVPYVGLPGCRFETLGTPFDQRAAARPQRGSGLRGAAADRHQHLPARPRRALLTLCGPAENVTVLATAQSDVATAPAAYGDHPIVLGPFGKRVVRGVDYHQAAIVYHVIIEGTPSGLGPIFAVMVGDDHAVLGEVGF